MQASVTIFLAGADAASMTVMLLLLVMSIVTWYLIISKFLQRRRDQKLIALAADNFWNAPSVSAASAHLAQHAGGDSFSRMAQQGIAAATHYRQHISGHKEEGVTLSEFMTRALRRAIALETTRQESGLTVLASIAGTAPFVGLFGTVWGIYHALISIGARGQNTLDAVAGPLGEALIMTAAGLVVAIPAVLGYNALVRSNRIYLSRLDTWAYDLHAYLTTGARINLPHFVADQGTGISPAKQAEAA